MPPTEAALPESPQSESWRPMATAPETAARLWLNHITLGPILAEGRRGRWYAPNAARQVWRWYRSAEPDALEPFSGWLPYGALAAERAAEGIVPARADDRMADRPRICARDPRTSLRADVSRDRAPASDAHPASSRRPNPTYP